MNTKQTTTTAEYTAAGVESCIQVQRDDAGAYTIPPAAEVETVEQLAGAGTALRTLGPLTGWAPWTEVAEAIDDDGEVSGLYFVAGRGA